MPFYAFYEEYMVCLEHGLLLSKIQNAQFIVANKNFKILRFYCHLKKETWSIVQFLFTF